MFLEAGGHLLNVVRIGSGGPWFVAHGGWVGSWELWQEPLMLMQDRWRCVAYDHRGAGASTAGPDDVTPQGLVDDLFTVLDHYGIDRCVLAGESLGALTCVTAVLQRPERFAGLVVIDGITATAGRVSDTAAVRADYARYVSAFVDACVPEKDADHLARWGRQVLLRADPEAAARMLEVHEDPPIRPDLRRIAVPTLVLHGDRDAIVPLAAGRATAQAVPGAELVVLPDAGHVPTMTRPAEVVEAIEDWAERSGLS